MLEALTPLPVKGYAVISLDEGLWELETPDLAAAQAAQAEWARDGQSTVLVAILHEIDLDRSAGDVEG